ncbi:hypothetical protein BKA67DRAFT_692958 [Truncatella angustata]|uniref:Uncharacterized protein n=1 Tax=Truncatella angustata TaxID=152316 RepID=A0A9P8UGH4_9PEZI|nr:uncharacterized protein BKA67DRAFT_692958 [Truncatella angustata]KAH6651698.1 hypothetical protein BKA67DRAFT_692958 [Truncatella angustata]
MASSVPRETLNMYNDYGINLASIMGWDPQFIPQLDEQVVGLNIKTFWKKRKDGSAVNFSKVKESIPRPHPIDEEYCEDCQTTWLKGIDSAQHGFHPYHIALKPSIALEYAMEPRSIVVRLEGYIEQSVTFVDGSKGPVACAGGYFGPGSEYNMELFTRLPPDHEGSKLSVELTAVVSVLARQNRIEELQTISKEIQPKFDLLASLGRKIVGRDPLVFKGVTVVRIDRLLSQEGATVGDLDLELTTTKVALRFLDRRLSGNTPDTPVNYNTQNSYNHKEEADDEDSNNSEPLSIKHKRKGRTTIKPKSGKGKEKNEKGKDKGKEKHKTGSKNLDKSRAEAEELFPEIIRDEENIVTSSNQAGDFRVIIAVSSKELYDVVSNFMYYSWTFNEDTQTFKTKAKKKPPNQPMLVKVRQLIDELAMYYGIGVKVVWLLVSKNENLRAMELAKKAARVGGENVDWFCGDPLAGHKILSQDSQSPPIADRN